MNRESDVTHRTLSRLDPTSERIPIVRSVEVPEFVLSFRVPVLFTREGIVFR